MYGGGNPTVACNVAQKMKSNHFSLVETNLTPLRLPKCVAVIGVCLILDPQDPQDPI